LVFTDATKIVHKRFYFKLAFISSIAIGACSVTKGARAITRDAWSIIAGTKVTSMATFMVRFSELTSAIIIKARPA
jgi:hypothetical protein